MLKKTFVSHLAVLIFLVLSSLTYSNTIDVKKAGKADPSIAKTGNIIHVNGYKGISYYAVLPSPENDPYYMYGSVAESYSEGSEIGRAEAVIPDFVIYRNYVRPSDKETAEEHNYLMPMTTPYISTNTSIGVAPYGYNYYTKKPANYHPIRDFRADYWKNKYYRDEFHNQASYQRSYSFYNYWNSAASDESENNDD